MTTEPEAKICVRCGVPFVTVPVLCPDRRAGDTISCDVLHYGERCPTCTGAVYEGRA